jgi:hypothetical protein
VIFWGTRGDSFDGDLWAGTSAGIAPIAQQRTDGPLGPNLGPGVQFTGIKPFYQATASGEAILLGGVTGGDSDGIWRTTPDGPQPLALEGAANHLGPNLGDGVVFTEIWQELGAEKGVDHLAFRATFAGDVAGIGIFKVGTTGNTLIALANSDGPLGPQLGPGISFGVPEARSVNNRGDVLVSSNISGANKPQRGVWINQGNGNVPVALTLTDALHGPQLGDGIEFLGIQQEDQYVDESGQVVFSALLRGTNVDASNDAGAWAWSNGRLYPLLREGELLNIDAGGGGYQRRVQSFSLGQGGDSFMAFDRPAASQGLIPLRIEFDDGSSGIFVTQIPEPSSNALVVFGLMSIAVWRGRKRAR